MRGLFPEQEQDTVLDVLHNCKRRTLGLNASPRREWLLDIDYVKRETFAYAILSEAIASRKGWKAILRRCSPAAVQRSRIVVAAR